MVQMKKCTTKEDVLEAVKERDVKFIRTQFTDTLGIIKSWAIPAEQLEEAFENGVMFDGSSIQGFTRIEESDMKLALDPSTFRILPWRPATGAVAGFSEMYIFLTETPPSRETRDMYLRPQSKKPKKWASQ